MKKLSALFLGIFFCTINASAESIEYKLVTSNNPDSPQTIFIKAEPTTESYCQSGYSLEWKINGGYYNNQFCPLKEKFEYKVTDNVCLGKKVDGFISVCVGVEVHPYLYHNIETSTLENGTYINLKIDQNKRNKKILRKQEERMTFGKDGSTVTLTHFYQEGSDVIEQSEAVYERVK